MGKPFWPIDGTVSLRQRRLTPIMAVISWNKYSLSPEREDRDITFTTTLNLPSGWKFGTALPVAGRARDL